MNHYFAELILTNQPVMIFGGGRVACRKLNGLLACQASVTVVAPQLNDEMRESWQRQNFSYHSEPYHSHQLQQEPKPVLVFAATSDTMVNGRIAADCQRLGILCNVVDAPLSSGFLVPAVIRRESVTVAIGTGGKSPALARVLKEYLSTLLHPGWGRLVAVFGALRREVQEQIIDVSLRERFWRQTALSALQEERFREEDAGNWLLNQLKSFREKN